MIPPPPSAADASGPLCALPCHVAVTGGAGFIGSHLVEGLLARGCSVHVVDDLSTGSLANLASVHDCDRLAVTVASVVDPGVAARVLAGADVVFHLAGAVGVQRLVADPLAAMVRNLRANEAVLEAAARARVPVVFASSSEVYGDGPVPFDEREPVRPGATEGRRGGYACAKAMGEWLTLGHAEQAGVPALVVRLFNTVGLRQIPDHGMVLPRFVEQAMQGAPLTVYGGGQQTRCFAHVAEVARALVELAAAPRLPGRVINVGSDIEIAVGALAELVRRRASSQSPIVHVPLATAFPAGFSDPPRRVPALSRLRAALGWVPSRPIETIVDELVAAAWGSAAGGQQRTVVGGGCRRAGS